MDTEIEHVKAIKSRASECSLLSADLKQIERDIAVLNSDLSSSGSTKTLQEVQDQYEDIQSQW
jgi:hypothetical protein